jgi:hypothetical protein
VKNLSDLIANLSAAWFSGEEHIVTLVSQPFDEQVPLCGLPAAVRAFECDESVHDMP